MCAFTPTLGIAMHPPDSFRGAPVFKLRLSKFPPLEICPNHCNYGGCLYIINNLVFVVTNKSREFKFCSKLSWK